MAMAVSPAIEQRFPVSAARVAIKSLLTARFKGAQAYSTEHTKALADEIRDQMKGEACVERILDCLCALI